MPSKASQIAAMFVRKRGRVPGSRHSLYFSAKTNRRDSSDDESIPARSRSRSINTQTDNRDYEKKPLRDKKHDHSSPKLSNVNIEKIDQSEG